MRHRISSVGAILTFALFSIGPAPGEQAPSADANAPEITSNEAPVTFSSKVNLVQVPVVVRDAQGRAVGNLKKEDFQLFDKGKLQLITRFSIEQTEAKTAPADAPAGGTTAETKPTPAAPALPDRYIAYVVDDVHLKISDLLQTRRAMNRHLDEALDAKSRAAIFTTTGKVVADFTDDREKLHKAVDSILPWTNGPNFDNNCPHVTYAEADYLVNQTNYLSGGSTDSQIANLVISGSADSVLTRLVKEAEHSCSSGPLVQWPPPLPPGTTLPGNFASLLPPDEPPVKVAKIAARQALDSGNQETGFSLGAVKDIIRRISTMPGSRTIVLVSPGFILTRDFRSAEYDVLDRAIRANVTINTIDMRGIYTVAGWTSDASQTGPFVAGATPAGAMSQSAISEASQAGDVLGELADGTGGTFFHNDNGLKEGLNQLAARPEVIYVLGFSPQDLKYDGAFHALKVKIGNVQNGGVSLQLRKGYWAPNHATDAAEQARDDIREAVFSSDEIRDIPLDVQTKFFKSGDQKVELTVTGHLDVGTLRFQKAQDRNNDTVTVVAGLFDSNGNFISGLERVLNLRLRDQTLAGIRSSGITVKETFHVAPGRYVVRMVVRDSEGQTMGSRNTGVEIQ
jgi:VWFA-related protein